jgi:hypothetical protein
MNYQGRRKARVYNVNVVRTLSYELQIEAVDENHAEELAHEIDYSKENEKDDTTKITLIELGV